MADIGSKIGQSIWFKFYLCATATCLGSLGVYQLIYPPHGDRSAGLSLVTGGVMSATLAIYNSDMWKWRNSWSEERAIRRAAESFIDDLQNRMEELIKESAEEAYNSGIRDALGALKESEAQLDELMPRSRGPILRVVKGEEDSPKR